MGNTRARRGNLDQARRGCAPSSGLLSGPASHTSRGVRVHLWTDLDQVPPGFGPSVVTIGNFDGVHRGHAEVLGRIVDLARERDARAVAVKFHPHPSAVHRPQSAPELITGIA